MTALTEPAKFDLFDPTLMSERPVTDLELAAFLGIAVRTVDYRVARKRLPPPADYGGPRGARRWFVGQLRAWLRRSCENAIANNRKINPDEFVHRR